jgi:hypothetical protein
MYDCLDKAKKIIIEHHKTLDPREFFEKCEFRIFIQTLFYEGNTNYYSSFRDQN